LCKYNIEDYEKVFTNFNKERDFKMNENENHVAFYGNPQLIADQVDEFIRKLEFERLEEL
jgi:3-hydroxy-3-methylglutaryl CoA synthase